jgi:hypothetical protein
MKTLKLLSISVSLLVILSACTLSGNPVSLKQIIPAGTAVTTILQINPIHTQTAIIALANTAPVEIASPIPTPVPPNVPVWLAYNYTCELVAGGGNMTMNLAWVDRSSTEDGYKVYRDNQVIATLAPNSTYYVDATFIPTGKTVSYSIEAFTVNWQASGSTITYGCQ